MSTRFAALTLTGLLLTACGRQVIPSSQNLAAQAPQMSASQAQRLDAARARLQSRSLSSQALEGEQVTASREVTLPVRSDDGSLTGTVTVRLEVVRTATSAYANTVWTYNYPHYAEGGALVQLTTQGGTFLAKSSSLRVLSFRPPSEGGVLPQTQALQTAYATSNLNEPLCASASGGLKYNGTFSFHMPITEGPQTPDTSFDLSVCESQPPVDVPTPPAPTDPFEFTQLNAWMTFNAKRTKSITHIALEGAPEGSHMDGVYLISIDPACDQTGEVADDVPLYVGDFWTEAQPPSQTVADRTFTDKARPYIHPATAVLATARVFDAQGNFIREVEDMSCLAEQ